MPIQLKYILVHDECFISHWGKKLRFPFVIGETLCIIENVIDKLLWVHFWKCFTIQQQLYNQQMMLKLGSYFFW